MKRTAAAVLALSMAVSAAALPASAGFNIDMSKVDGDVEITQVDDNGSAKVTIKVGGVEKTNDFSDGKEGNDVTITGDNTKSTATENLNAEEENTSEVEKSGENASEVEKTGEDTAEAEKTEEQAQEPGSLELLAPEDEEKQAQEKETQEKPADSQEPEQTEKTSDQVIEYGQYDAEAQKEAAKPAAKPAAEQKAEEKTYEDTNAPASITEKAQDAARNVVKIINNFTTPLKVILRNLKVEAGDTKESAVTVSGTGDVTLELDGKNELKGGSYWSKDGLSESYLSGGHGLHAQGKGTLTIQDEDKDGSLTAVGGDVETSNLQSTNNDQWLWGGDGIRASNLTVSGAEIKAEGGNSKATGRSDMMSGGGAGIQVQGPNGGDAGTAKFLDGAHITAKGGDAYVENQKEVVGGIGIAISANAEIEGVSISAAGGNAEGKKYARSGSAMDLYGNYMQYTLSMKDSALELTGGNAKAEGEVSKGPVLSEMYHDNPTLKNLTITAVEGKTKASKAGWNGGLLYFNGGTREVGGNSTITLVGTRTDGIVAKDNTVVNLYVPEGETLKKADSVDKISADETGKVNIYENATTTKNEDGSITVTGDLVGIKQDGHSYELTATVEPTCTTPGKRVYTCTTHEGETYEEIISDALGHHFVNGVCTRCGAPESNGGSSAVTLTVTGAGAYETSIADGRYVIAVPAETAVLSGCLSNLKELKAQGADTIVFRTQLRETVLNIDSMLSLGVDDTLFALTHSGESAELTVGGFAHNELLH